MMSNRRRSGFHFALLSIVCACLASLFAFAYGSAFYEAEASPSDAATHSYQDYTRFQHSNPQHSRLPCLLCHKRDDNSAAPKLSGHLPCSGCHVQQFADNSGPMCTICHTGGGGLKRFPRLRSFNVRFDHANHLRQTNCATCHKPSRRGVALSVPSGLGAHNTCYTCHGPQTEVGGRNIGSCGVCHQTGRPTRNSDWASAFAVNFSHSEHSRRNDCAACHKVSRAMPRGKQVSAPTAAMHFASARTLSCASCHNNVRAFGDKDFSSCKRCHEGRTFKF